MTKNQNKRIFRQGDVYLLEIDKEKLDSEDIEELEKAKEVSKLPFRHGEDGHDHIVFGKNKSTRNGNYIQVLEPAEVRHENQEGHGDHKPFAIPIGLYQVLQEKTYNVFRNEIRYARD